MRVVFLNPLALIGGAEFILLDLLAALPEALPGVDRQLVIASEPGPLSERAEALGVQVHHLPFPEAISGLGDSALRGRGRISVALGLGAKAVPTALATRRYARGLGRLLDDLNPDLIHSNGMKLHLLMKPAAPRSVPVVWHAHDFFSTRALMSRALRWASNRASGIIAISEAVGRDVRSVLPRVPVSVVYNAIDTNHFVPSSGGDARWLDERAGLEPAPPGCARVGLVATYARWKGQDLFLRALALLPRDRPIRATIIGGPIYKTRGSQYSVEELRALAEELGVADRVGFVPFQEDTAEVYRALDVVVHASTQPEPFGRTIAEAMACGRAVVVSNEGGAAELFADDVDAVGFTPRDPRSLADAILALSEDRERRARLGARARASAVEKFSRERLGLQVAEVYRGIVGSREPAPTPTG